MPIGCQLTVTTPSLLNVSVKASIELKEGYDIEDVKLDFEASLNDYPAFWAERLSDFS